MVLILLPEVVYKNHQIMPSALAKALVASTKPLTLPQSNLSPWNLYAITLPCLASVINASVI